MKRRILVVEDSETFCRPLQRTLEVAGYEVSVVPSAEEALGVLGRGETDLVLTDIRLPGMDGLELVRRVKSEYPGLRVIVMTAHGMTESARGITGFGVDHYLVKPFEPTELLDAIRRAIARLQGGAGEETTPAPWSRPADQHPTASAWCSVLARSAADIIERRPA